MQDGTHGKGRGSTASAELARILRRSGTLAAVLAALLACKRGGDTTCSSDADCMNGLLCESSHCIPKETAEKIRGAGAPAPAGLALGDRVSCNWSNTGSFYSGKVAELRPGGRVFVRYDDGDEEETTADKCRKQSDGMTSATTPEPNVAGGATLAAECTDYFDVVECLAGKAPAAQQRQIRLAVQAQKTLFAKLGAAAAMTCTDELKRNAAAVERAGCGDKARSTAGKDALKAKSPSDSRRFKKCSEHSSCGGLFCCYQALTGEGECDSCTHGRMCSSNGGCPAGFECTDPGFGVRICQVTAGAGTPAAGAKEGKNCSGPGDCGGLKCCFSSAQGTKYCSASCQDAVACTSNAHCPKGHACELGSGVCVADDDEPEPAKPSAQNQKPGCSTACTHAEGLSFPGPNGASCPACPAGYSCRKWQDAMQCVCDAYAANKCDVTK